MMRADVEKDEAAVQLARQASEALAGLLDHERTQAPDGDRFDRCSETLDELARALMTIVEVVEHCTANSPVEEDPDGLTEKARDLATAIVRRRNSLFAESAAARLHVVRAAPVPRAG